MSVTEAPTCSRCGAHIPSGARFCASCGLDISGSQGGVATLHADAPPATVTQAALLEGLRQATLGEYEVLGELGRGGMATVYLAHDIALDRKVAIKVMSPTLFRGEEMAERFKREARTAGQLSHPHIIPIYAVKESAQLLYFVMKFIEGRPIDSIIKELGPLPVPMVQTILQQVGSALGYAHRRGVIHRDIKPANIMIDSDGWAVVTDFGIAKVSEKQGLTMTGATIGTPSYMSPEQCAAKELTGASDQYSLGVVAYEMLSGKLPFVAESVMAVMYAHFNEPPSPIQQARPDCPPDLGAAVMKMLEKDPANRFPSIEAAVAAAGAAPLAPDDPIRTQMMTLAAQGDSLKLLERISTPVSQPSAMRSGAGSPATRPSVATLMISPARVTIPAGGAVQLLSTPKTRGGQTLANRPVSWASTNTSVARVSPNGLVTAAGPGTVTITASSENTSATAIVTVTAGRSLKRVLGVAVGGLVLAGIAAAVWRFGPHGRVPTPAQRPEPQTSLPVSQAPAPEGKAPAPPETTSTAARGTAPVERSRAPQSERAVDRDEAAMATALGTALSARGQAVAAGATVADLARGDDAERTAQQLRQDRLFADAVEQLSVARSFWAVAEAAARARADSVAAALRRAEAAPTPVQPPRDTVTLATPPVADPIPLIGEAIAAYGRAIESRDTNVVRQAYPGMTPSQAEGWQAFFNGAGDIQAELRYAPIELSGNLASTTLSITLTYQNRDQHRKEKRQTMVQARLARHGASWEIVAIQ